MAMGCSSLHGHHQDPKNLAFCRRLQPAYKEYDYQSLMNTTFGLVPAGRSPATYRLVEAMGAGAIPVVVARDFVLPFREQLDWPSFSFSFAPDQVGPELVRTLRAIPQMQLEEMQVSHHSSRRAGQGLFFPKNMTPWTIKHLNPFVLLWVTTWIDHTRHPMFPQTTRSSTPLLRKHEEDKDKNRRKSEIGETRPGCSLSFLALNSSFSFKKQIPARQKIV